MKKIIMTVVAILAMSNCFAREFAVRGMHIDMRTQVMTMKGLKSVADKMADAGMNTLIMEWEGSFPFERNATLCNPDAYSKEEVVDFIAYCNGLGIDVIPLQNCFGHCDYILRHERYAPLREDASNFSQVCPLKQELAAEMFKSIFQDICDLHNSKYIHIGCDETRLLGHCSQCAGYVQEHGVSDLFTSYVSVMCKVVSDMGKTPVIWADILLKYPDAVDKLPKNLVVVDWNYGWSEKKFGDIGKIQAAGIEMWGAPSLRSSPDNIYSTEWEKHLRNLEVYIPFCLDKGFTGIIETSWSTSGLYGQIIDGAQGELNDMQPIRQVYPACGFDMLQRAFFKSVNDGGLDGHAFVREYASEHFGLDASGQDVLERYFYMPQTPVGYRKGNFNDETISEMLKEAEAVKSSLASLSVKKNRADFKHLKLMLDIRLNFLRFLKVNCSYESESFDASRKAQLAGELAPVLREARKIDKRYRKAVAWYLKDTSVAFGKFSYVNRMQIIYDSLK